VPGVHTLYISPLKALAVDIQRNLSKPVEEMGLPVGSRRGPATRRNRAASARSSTRRTSC
jgi:ATP-dependent Lhr-like helicase